MIAAFVLILVGAVVVFTAVYVSTGKLPLATNRDEANANQPPVAVFDIDGSISAESLSRTRFEVVPRGYKMDEVDAVISAIIAQLGKASSAADLGPNSLPSESAEPAVDSTGDSGQVSTPAAIPGSADVELRVAVNAPVEKVWRAVVDWPAQGEWMLGTKVWVSGGDGASVGSKLSAFTGVGKIGFLDTMTITSWSPPNTCEVVHTGRVVRGTGAMSVVPAADGTSTFIWQESLQLPWGWLGRAGWPIVKPLFLAGVRRSLDSFATWAAQRG